MNHPHNNHNQKIEFTRHIPYTHTAARINACIHLYCCTAAPQSEGASAASCTTLIKTSASSIYRVERRRCTCHATHGNPGRNETPHINVSLVSLGTCAGTIIALTRTARAREREGETERGREREAQTARDALKRSRRMP